MEPLILCKQSDVTNQGKAAVIKKKIRALSPSYNDDAKP